MPVPAARALTYNRVAPGLHLNCDRLHQRAARIGAIARIDVYVQAPQAVRAVIRVAGPTNGCTTVKALEIFDRASELLHVASIVSRGLRFGCSVAGHWRRRVADAAKIESGQANHKRASDA